MHAMRGFVVVLAVLVAVVLPASTAAAAPDAERALTTVPVKGVEYAASLTEGRFGGVAHGGWPGLWTATVVHEPLRRGEAVPITGGSFTLRGQDGAVRGRFVDGDVTPADVAGPCDDERFDVAGTLDLDDGGTGSFRVVLTHLRRQTDAGCRAYGATVVGSLLVPSRAIAG